MEVEAKKKLLNSITEEEYKAIGESVLKKVANILDEYVGDYVKAKAYFQSSCANHGSFFMFFTSITLQNVDSGKVYLIC